MEGSHGSSYGGRFSGGDFDLIEFIKRPLTLCRLLCILFAIVVFGCISAAGYDQNYHLCIFNKNQDACNYGIAIGVLAFVACIFFLAVDTQFDKLSNVTWRRYAVILDLGFSAVWSFLWFVGFCFLADTWRKSKNETVFQNQTNHARAAIAFSFFSIFSWVGLTLMGYHRYRQGDGITESSKPNEYSSTFPPTYGHNENKQYASFPYPTEEDSYQQQPFGVPPQQPFGVPQQQPFGVPPQQPFGATPVQTDYSVP